MVLLMNKKTPIEATTLVDNDGFDLHKQMMEAEKNVEEKTGFKEHERHHHEL